MSYSVVYYEFNVNDLSIHYIQEKEEDVCHFVHETAPENDKVVAWYMMKLWKS